MRRDPTLHIKKSDLLSIVSKMKFDGRTPRTKIVDTIFKNASEYQITDRYLGVLNQKSNTKKKLIRSMSADAVPAKTVEKFNLMLFDVRYKKNPVGRIRTIDKNSKQYLLLKEIAKMAYDFSEHFNISPRDEGMREFILMGIDKMGKYTLNRFKTYEQSIYESMENKIKVLQDSYKNDTTQFYASWQHKMLEHTGSDALIHLDTDVQKYVHMIYGREAAAKANCEDYEDWIEAQFSGLAFLNVIPELSQFYGENALKRYERYILSLYDHKDNDENSVTEMY